MSTKTPAVPAAPAAPVAPKADAPAKTRSVTFLNAAKDSRIRVTFKAKKGSFETFAEKRSVDKSGKPKKGEKASFGLVERHTTREEAEKAHAAKVDAVEKAGWARQTGGGGGPRTSSFDLTSIPKAK